MGLKDLFTFSSYEELKKLQDDYANFFKFCNDYGYSLIEKEVKVDSHFNRRMVHNPKDDRLEYKYDKVVRVLLKYRRPADLVAISNQFETLTSKKLFIPSEVVENQYIAFVGWRPYDDSFYKVKDIIFNFGKTCHMPYFYDGKIEIYRDSTMFDAGLFKHIRYENMESLYKQFIYKVTEDLVNTIKWHRENPSIYNRGWYMERMIGKYEDLIPTIE